MGPIQCVRHDKDGGLNIGLPAVRPCDLLREVVVLVV